MRLCDFPECGNPNNGGGLCAGHGRQRKLGRDLAPLKKQMPHGRTPFDVLDAHTPRGLPDTDCWPWGGAIYGATGYGVVSRKKRYGGNTTAHRVAWERANGRALRAGELVRHTCDNRRCVNPNHLVTGSPADNAADLVVRKRWGGTRPRYSDAEIAAMRQAARDGTSHARIRAEFGVSAAHLTRVLAGKTRH